MKTIESIIEENEYKVIEQSEYKVQAHKLLRLIRKYRNELEVYHKDYSYGKLKNKNTVLEIRVRWYDRLEFDVILKKRRQLWRSKKVFSLHVTETRTAPVWCFSYLGDIKDLILIHDVCHLMESRIAAVEIDNEAYRSRHKEIESRVNDIAEIIEISNAL